MHTDPLIFALALSYQRQAEERARFHRLAKETRAARRAAAPAPSRRPPRRPVLLPFVVWTGEAA